MPTTEEDGSRGPDARVDDEPAADDAFGALGHEARTRILEAMLDRAGGDGPSRMTFSELFEATDLETTAGFAYHLDELVGVYLRKVDDEAGDDGDRRTDAGYEFTYAGRKIARAIAAGSYTRSVDRPPIELDDPCPLCATTGGDGTGTLEARSRDNVVTVSCRDCERPILELQFPPSGLASHGDGLPDAFDRHHRYRVALAADGVCPECGGVVDAALDSPPEALADSLPPELREHVQAELSCGTCGFELRCPVTLAVLEHPAVISFYDDHGENVRERPLWNVGAEWTETVLSADPACVRVVTELDGETLALYLDGSLRVVDVQRSAPAERSSAVEPTADGTTA
ncbi:DUF7351 domain-containing protein [Salinilacihabitans rarus]|uniref:DUF7351 domain-containing protein n=1 Tax=Salinilacihabitans rarus TaxID=2961596 RepID=UPI0020C85062|nr:ArsR family transcriptional regulator [Salinilacihabitans rarus]